MTRQTFTSQYSDSTINLLDYGSRRYDPALGRFIQPDSIVPVASQGAQAYDRYAYVNNNPVNFNDPSGHMMDKGGDGGCVSNSDCNTSSGDSGGNDDVVVIPNGVATPPSTLPTTTPTPQIVSKTPPQETATTPVAASTPCSTPMPGTSLCSSQEPTTGHPPETSLDPDDKAFLLTVFTYVSPFGYFRLGLTGQTPISTIVGNMFGTEVGKWYGGQNIINVYGVSLLKGGPLIVMPTIKGNPILFDSPYIPKLFPEYH